MNLENLRDHVAAAVFCALIRRNDHGEGEYADIGLIAATAWDFAGAFVDNRPASSCEACIHQIAREPP